MILRELHTCSAVLQRAYAEALNLGEREMAAEIRNAAEQVSACISRLVAGGKKAS